MSKECGDSHKGHVAGAAIQRPRRALLAVGAAFHPSLQDQDCSHAVYRLAAFFNRQIGFTEEAIGFGGGKPFVPEMDR